MKKGAIFSHTLCAAIVLGAWVALVRQTEPECPPEETRPAVYEPVPLLIPEHEAYGCMHALATSGPGRDCA